MGQAEPSILQIQIEQLIFCSQCGSDQYRKDGKNKSSGSQIYQCKQCGQSFTPAYAKPEYVVNPQAEYAKDVWDCRALGIDGGVGKSSHKLNFTQLSQPWIKQTAKQ